MREQRGWRRRDARVPTADPTPAVWRLPWLCIAAVFVGCAALALPLFPSPSAAPPPVVAQDEPAAFTLVGTHPRAVRQPSTRGETLNTLEAWRGRIYAGYGDYGDNTGPISIMPFDPVSRTFRLDHVSDTEAIDSFRVIGDQLWAPATDRRKNADFAVGEPWRDLRPLVTTHAYDVATLDGEDLWLSGSKGVNATLWRSTDGGETWAVAQREGPGSGLDNDFARYYFIGVLDGRLYVQADDFYGTPHARSRVFDGTRWRDGPNLLLGGMGWRPVTVAGHLVYLSYALGGSLLAFDGEVVRRVGDGRARGVTLDEHGVLHVIYEPPGGESAVLLRSTDLARWEQLEAAVPDGARSLAILDGTPYIGATGARLFALTGRPSWRPVEVGRNALPTARLRTPADGSVWRHGAPVLVAGDALDADGPDARPDRVQVWAGSELLAELREPPYAIAWTDAPTGTHRIVLRAIDAEGLMAVDRATIEVRPRAPLPRQVHLPRLRLRR